MAPKRKEEGKKKEGKKERRKNYQNFHQQQQPTKNQIIQWCQS